MELQMFAEEEEVIETETTEQPSEKMYTESEMNEQVDKIVAKKLAEAKKKSDKAIETAKAEAEKLAQMNADEKQRYELEQKEKELEEKAARIAELEKEQTRSGLARQAAQILKDEHGIVATQEMLDFVVGDDAEQTENLIKKLVGIIEDDRKAQEKTRATGSTPKDYSGKTEAPSEIQKRIAKYV
ncbi:MAG: DUF4355 domain-containing protein [Bacteroidales bacterium]|nr:DUF4355 domain-containing protein [Bacteroidales bacterium]